MKNKSHMHHFIFHAQAQFVEICVISVLLPSEMASSDGIAIRDGKFHCHPRRPGVELSAAWPEMGVTWK